ncbi:protein rolling stone-like [Culicoides brevitarsis]|uniref:protein rolling stone-like n=1 Tax=Culicoides brevitarsis TaxID=469753 RepID=UPI00307B4ACB
MQIKHLICTKFGMKCSTKQLKCEHDDPEKFVKSQWQQTSRCYTFLIYRWILALFFISALIYSFYNHITKFHEISKFFIYLTNQGFVLCVTYSVLAAVVTTWYFQPAQLENIETTENMPLILRIIWVMHNVSLTLSVVITLVYWTLLYDSDKDQLDAKNILTHICNSIVMFIDLMIIAHPIYLMHVLYPILLGIFYAIFSVIYQFAGGLNLDEKPYIYGILDWTKPQKAFLIFFGVICLATFIHCCLWAVCQLRIKIFKFCNQKNKVSFKDSPPAVVSTTTTILDGNENLSFTREESYKKVVVT